MHSSAQPSGTDRQNVPAQAGWVLASLIAVATVANLGLAVANVALPRIGQHFDASQTDLNLVAVAYSLGLACSVLYFGAVGDRYGRKGILLLGMLVTIPADLLAAFAHPDDAELLVGGTLARAYDQGHRTGILDLTRGEMGSKGTPELRADEAARAAEILGVAERHTAGLPDGHLQNSDAMRRVVVEWLRRLRPRTVLLPFPVGRHPDHRIASELIRDACFLSGLRNYPADGEPYKVPSTIDDPAILDEIKAVLQELGYARGPRGEIGG